MNQVVDFINVNRDRYVEELKQYLAIPSISALPQHSGDVRRAAEWTGDALRTVGMENVRLIDTPGNPVVYGDWMHAPGKPTILFYGHYDVQPVDPVELWTSPPFEATVRDGEIYARGAADDKGQVFMHIKAVEAHIKQAGNLPINMKFFIEGEEEVGSVHLDDFVRSHKQDLGADVVVISDSPMFDRGIPSICYGLRGLTYFQIDLRGTRSDLHSGSFGGAVANPAFVLAQLLAQMKDRSGRIRIPGFYDAVRPLSDAERAEWKKLPFNETKYRKELGAPKLFGETGYSTLERVWARPTFEVNGLLSGFTGEGAKTVLPAAAMAKVSMRLVPDQEPAKIGDLFEEYVKKICPKTVELKITRMHGGKPWMTEFDNKFVRAAGRAIERGFGQAPVFNREGGSIPVVSTFQQELGLPSVLFGVGLPDENAHAPDERLDLGNFHNGIIASAYLYEEIAQLEQ
ncbi:MAG TPA: dipeptidase [Vicinamibacterales bacterium]|jgi:acetylornithine deacetylase/succinyl-diaminopimelate desuccinylase-like protein|nr:dipeptidase [Vicinamibacterales bacterium]